MTEDKLKQVYYQRDYTESEKKHQQKSAESVFFTLQDIISISNRFYISELLLLLCV